MAWMMGLGRKVQEGPGDGLLPRGLSSPSPLDKHRAGGVGTICREPWQWGEGVDLCSKT